MAFTEEREIRRKGAFFILMLLFLIFVLYSVTVAIWTVEDCGDDESGAKHWRIIPPAWVCD